MWLKPKPNGFRVNQTLVLYIYEIYDTLWAANFWVRSHVYFSEKIKFLLLLLQHKRIFLLAYRKFFVSFILRIPLWIPWRYSLKEEDYFVVCRIPKNNPSVNSTVLQYSAREQCYNTPSVNSTRDRVHSRNMGFMILTGWFLFVLLQKIWEEFSKSQV